MNHASVGTKSVAGRYLVISRAFYLCLALSLSLSLPFPTLGQVDKEQQSVRELANRVAAATSETERGDLLKTNQALIGPDLVRALVELSAKDKVNLHRLALLEFTKGLAQQISDNPDLIRVLLEIAKTQLSLKEKEKAAQTFAEVSDTLPKTGDDLRAGLALVEIGDTYNGNQLFALSGSWFQQGLKRLEPVATKEGSIARGRAWLGLAIGQEENGDFDHALLSLRQAEAMFGSSSYQPGLAKVYGERGNLYDFLGNAELAKASFESSLKAFEALGAESHKLEIAKVKVNLGLVLTLRLGEDDAAIRMYKEAFALGEDLLSKWEMAAAHGNMGIAYDHLKNYTEALRQHQLSRDGFLDKDVADMGAAGNELSATAGVQLAMHRLPEALSNATEAAKLGKELNIPELRTVGLMNQGRTLRELGRLDEAKAAFKDAIELIEDYQTHGFGNEESQSGFFEDQVYAYRDMVQLLIEQQNAEEAFKYTERYKARALLGALVSKRNDFTKGMTEKERDEEKEIEKTYSELNSQVLSLEQDSKANDAELKKLKDELSIARRRQQDFYLSVYATHPELRSRRVAFADLSLQQIGDLLPDSSAAALQYVVSENAVFLLTITKATNNGPARITTINLTSDIEALKSKVYQFRSLLDEAPRAGFVPLAQDLYNLLVGKAEKELGGKKYLIIVPDEMLWELPFQALMSGNNKYLIEDRALSYAPSLTALRELERLKDAHPRGAQKFLALANPELSKNQVPQSNAVPAPLMGGPLQSLPAAETQVKEIAKIFGPERTSVYMRNEATETRVKAEGSGARIIHLAAHGSMNSAMPMYSYIVLSQVGNADGEDGLLEAWELMSIPLAADMVVLSACETARGRVRPGEGIIGLSWAVAIAGCPTVVSSQWKVDPTSTSLLMQGFYRSLYSNHLKTKEPQSIWLTEMSKAAALQKASIDLLNNNLYRHPHFWAGFIVIGDAR